MHLASLNHLSTLTKVSNQIKMFFKEEPSIPIPITWPYPASEVFVTGDFNSFAHQELYGGDEKCGVIWAPPARIHLRFLVDGTYLHNPSLPHDFMDGKPYNYIDAAPMPIELKHLRGLSLAELERLDCDLFGTQISICLDFSESSQGSPTKTCRGAAVLQQSSIGTSHDLSLWTAKVKAAITIQKHIRRFRTRERFLLVKDAAQHIQAACRTYISNELRRLKTQKTYADEVCSLRKRISSLEATCSMWSREAKRWKNVAEDYKTKVGATLGRSASSAGNYKENALSSTSRATYVHVGSRNALPLMKVQPSRLSG